MIRALLVAATIVVALTPPAAGGAGKVAPPALRSHVRQHAAMSGAPHHYWQNLALGRPATASSELPGNPASLAVDGNRGTLWNSTSWPPGWIEVDLEAVRSVGEFDLVVSQLPDSYTTHRVYGKAAAGDQYTLLHEFSGFTHDGDVLHYVLPEQQQLRYIKIETTNSQSWVAWREVEIYGPGNMTFLDDGQVKVGVDLDLGGVITHVSPTGGGDAENLVNEHDTGRDVQQSYYSGGAGPGDPCPGSANEWNPVGAGDCNGNRSTVLDYSNDGTTIYVKSRPLMWPLDNVPCECTFEQWISLSGRAVEVRNRLVNDRSDKTQYFARWQELPAFYTIGRLGHLYSYIGNAPYSGAAPTEITADLPSAAQFRATEQWAANVDDSGSGLGIVSPDVQTFFGGFWGTRGIGGSLDDPTGWIAPARPEILDWNISYEYSYALVLGTLAEIRDYATAHKPDLRPDYHFSTDRQGWWYWNAADTGAPIDGALHVKPNADDPQMFGPEGFWAAQDAPKLYIRAAYHSTQNRAEIFWRSPNNDFDGSRVVEFRARNDGAFHTYVVDLASAPGYTGTIGQLRFDPVDRGEGDATIDVDYISWKPQERTLSVAVDGSGSVVSLPAGISCPATCSASFPDTTEVTLTAAHAPGFAFAGWAGCELQEPTCDVTIDGDATLRALFVPGIHHRTVSLSFRRRLARGHVHVADGVAQCRSGARVRLERRAGRRWKLVATGRTNVRGAYAIRVGPGHGVYRAAVPARRYGFGHRCTAATSGARRR